VTVLRSSGSDQESVSTVHSTTGHARLFIALKPSDHISVTLEDTTTPHA
jgi:hypothetical protein